MNDWVAPAKDCCDEVMRWWADDESECGLFVLSKSPTSPSSLLTSLTAPSLQSTPLYLFGLVSTQINNFNRIMFSNSFPCSRPETPLMWCTAGATNAGKNSRTSTKHWPGKNNHIKVLIISIIIRWWFRRQGKTQFLW